MAISAFQRMQANAIGEALHKFPESDRLEIFEMMLARFCLFCGKEKVAETEWCDRCGGKVCRKGERLMAFIPVER